MIRQLAFAALAALACAAVHAGGSGDSSGSPAAGPGAMLQPDLLAAPSDLTLDADFDGNGKLAIIPPVQPGWSDVQGGRQVAPWIESIPAPSFPVLLQRGYYLIGKQQNAAGNQYRAWIGRVNMQGELDTSFGTNGWIFGIGQDDIIDAVVVDDKAYVLGNIWASGGESAPPRVRVNCIDLTTATGSNCFPPLAGTVGFGAGTGYRVAAYGQRIIHDSRYGLFVAARVIHSPLGDSIGIARLDADTGSLVSEFGPEGGYGVAFPPWADKTGLIDIKIHDMMVTPAGYPGTPRLYLAGAAGQDPTAHDGFLVAGSPDDGHSPEGWGWKDIAYEDDNMGSYRDDAVTALAVLRNGKVAFAGWSATDDPDLSPMIMGRFNEDGSYDASFCAGNPNRNNWACMVEQHIDEFYWPQTVPVALAEREENRDLVVALRSQNNGTAPPTNVLTRLEQYSANGNVLHAAINLDYTVNTPWSRPFAMWMGRTGVLFSGEERIAVIGTRRRGSSTFDGVMTHLKATDSIFADQFGGRFGD